MITKNTFFPSLNEYSMRYNFFSLYHSAIIVCAWGDKGAAAGRNEEVICATASPPDQIVDTLGAGDTFNAAFIYSQVKKIDWKKGLQFACLIAGCKIGQKGFQGIEKFKDEALVSLYETPVASAVR